MNVVLVNWRNDKGSMVVTVGWLIEDDDYELTVCSDISNMDFNRFDASRVLRIPYSRVLDVTHMAPQSEDQDVVN